MRYFGAIFWLCRRIGVAIVWLDESIFTQILIDISRMPSPSGHLGGSLPTIRRPLQRPAALAALEQASADLACK